MATINKITELTKVPRENNAEVKTTSVGQDANEILGTQAKKLYYLIVKTDKGQLVINVGEKTHNEVKKLTE